jgi:hypothetical protein
MTLQEIVSNYRPKDDIKRTDEEWLIHYFEESKKMESMLATLMNKRFTRNQKALSSLSK